MEGNIGNMVLRFFCAALLLFLTACQHVQSPPARYSDLPERPGSKTNIAQLLRPSLSPVKLSNQMDPSWLQPPTELFTLGPGDKLEIELLGEPTSRTTTIV